ncbi:hypothetical protein DBIPINDM_004536 [Mesorhizobium sp. AR02]|uniref:shikimate dehydrogenase family protein n=1 Tax=Mesorhizobium sp. AR02 TaxID=2865837 RepID=UPI00215FB001|nr:shikimate dehydrogenase [Mesorhizobium sp. AR02]UVK51290.1 hypothetical protein DBIPINDM_004536 [Mesorhizobium sp. AR02]
MSRTRRCNGVVVEGVGSLVIGAGGVARGHRLLLADAGLGELILANRSADRAVALAADIQASILSCKTQVCEAEAPDVAAGVDLIVNATTLGMQEGGTLPLNIAALEPTATVAEVIVNPAITPLLAAAAGRDCAIVSGIEMLKPQPRLAAEFFGLRSNQEK